MIFSAAFVETYFVPLQLALAMFGMGAALRPSDFLSVGRQPSGLVLGLGLQLIFVPLLAVAFIELLGLSPGWAVGLCLVAAVPGGAFSNLLTFIGRGNIALSIAVTVASTTLCVVTVPLLLKLLVSSSLPADFVFPLDRVVLEIGAYLIGPLILGMVARRLFENRSELLSKIGIRGALLLIIVISVSAMRSGRIRVEEYGWMPPLVIIAFGTILAIVTPLICRLVRRNSEDAVAITIEVTVRNIGVGLLVVHFFFPGAAEQGQVLYTCLFYAGASPFFAVPPAIAHRLVPGEYPRPLRAIAVWRRRRQEAAAQT